MAAAAAPVDIMDMDMGAMTEEQQLEWALRMSMQVCQEEHHILFFVVFFGDIYRSITYYQPI